MDAASLLGLFAWLASAAPATCGAARSAPAAHALPAQEPAPEGEVARSEPETTYGPEREIELALSDETFWLAYQAPFARGTGYYSMGLFGNEDDDYLANARVLRYGEPTELPVSVGVGLAFYAATLDEPEDEVYALALTGSARYHFPTTYPTSAGIDLSFAPDVTTFDDGDRLLDVGLRVETELSSFAKVFVGYRYLEVDLRRASDRELDDRLHVGLRLGL